MKLAVLADIHGNEQGMRAVLDHLAAWGPDHVVVAGDVINRGPRPAECLREILRLQREQGWQLIIGNHEQYVIRQDSFADATPEMRALFQPTHWTWRQVGADLTRVREWPFSVEFADPAGDLARVTHASMLGTRDGVFRQTPDDELARKLGPPDAAGRLPALFCVGHTHIPLVRRLPGMPGMPGSLVINVGAVGMPFDGDARVSYGQMTLRADGWHAEVIRLAYDHARAERDFFDSGFIDEGGPLARVMLCELRGSYGLLFDWTSQFEKPVLAGEITIAQSVERYLRARGLET